MSLNMDVIIPLMYLKVIVLGCINYHEQMKR